MDAQLELSNSERRRASWPLAARERLRSDFIPELPVDARGLSAKAERLKGMAPTTLESRDCAGSSYLNPSTKRATGASKKLWQRIEPFFAFLLR